MSVWYPGSGLTYVQYLQAESFKRDINGEIRTGSRYLGTKVSNQTRELVATNKELSVAFGKGFESVDGTLHLGLNRLESALQDANASIESMRGDFNYTMGLLLEEAHVQNRALLELLDKLDQIHKTLESPTLTQAREFYRIGCQRLSRGLVDKALEAFIESEKKNDTDFFVQFQIGKLYLYGVDEEDGINVVDLTKAHSHLLLASRYAKAEMNTDASFSGLAAEALLLASFAVYHQSGQMQTLADEKKSNPLFEEAMQLCSEALKLNPGLYEAAYHLAKYSALMGDSESSLSYLERAINADRNYAVKVDVDHAFDLVRLQVVAMLTRMRDSKRIESQAEIMQAEELVTETSSWHPEESDVLGLPFRKCEEDLLSAQECHATNTYFGYLDAISLSEAIIASSPAIKAKWIEYLKDRTIKLVEQAKDKTPKSTNYTENVKRLVTDANTHISNAGRLLETLSYESLKAALTNAGSAAMLIDRANREQRAADELRAKRRHHLFDDVSRGIVYGMMCGAFAGCVSCSLNQPPGAASDARLYLWHWSFNFLTGGLYGGILGWIYGVLHNHSRN